MSLYKKKTATWGNDEIVSSQITRLTNQSSENTHWGEIQESKTIPSIQLFPLNDV